ncbi:MAG: sulfatase [Gemmatimonadales bacterium]
MSLRRTDVLLTALWMGLMAGLLEGVLYNVPPIDRFSLRQTLDLGPNRLWLAAATNLVWFGLAALPITFLHLRWPGVVTGARTLGAFAGLAALSLALIYSTVHEVALALIAIGVGTQAARFLVGRDEKFVRFMHRTLVPLVALVVLCAGGAILLPRYRAMRTLAAGPTPAPGQPNVLLIILDTVRGFDVSMHGYERATTPHLEQRATEGLVFDNAMATAPWTLPSHGSMFTGQYPFALSTAAKVPLDKTHRTLAEVFTAQGYRTGGFVGNIYYCGIRFGLGRGFLHYEAAPLDVLQVMRHSTLGRWVMARVWFPIRDRLGKKTRFARRNAPDVTDGFLAWSDDDTARPYFAFLNYFDAHYPYLPPPPYDRRFAPDTQPTFVPPSELSRKAFTPAVIARARNAYNGAIGFLDSELGRLFDSLARRGTLDNTIVIVTSDHGEQFGEFGLLFHGNSVYRPVLQVPLLIRFPGAVPRGIRVTEPITLRDIGATALDLAGILPSRPWPGASLRAAWDSSYAGPPISLVYSELRKGPTWRQSINGGGYQLYRDVRGNRKLFDMSRGRDDEMNLLGGDTAGRGIGPVVARLERQLDSLVPAPLRTFKPDTVRPAAE